MAKRTRAMAGGGVARLVGASVAVADVRARAACDARIPAA